MSKKRKVGRPPLPDHKKPIAMTVRMDRECKMKFDKLSKKYGSQRSTLETLVDSAYSEEVSNV